LAKLFEFAELNDYDSDVSLGVTEALFALLDHGSHNCRHQNVDDAFQLLILFVLSVLSHEMHLAADFVPVSIVDPQEQIGNNAEGHPCELQVLLDKLILRFCVLDDRQADVQKRDRTQDANYAHEVD